MYFTKLIRVKINGAWRFYVVPKSVEEVTENELQETERIVKRLEKAVTAGIREARKEA